MRPLLSTAASSTKLTWVRLSEETHGHQRTQEPVQAVGVSAHPLGQVTNQQRATDMEDVGHAQLRSWSTGHGAARRKQEIVASDSAGVQAWQHGGGRPMHPAVQLNTLVTTNSAFEWANPPATRMA